jgi:hypothetical protein
MTSDVKYEVLVVLSLCLQINVTFVKLLVKYGDAQRKGICQLRHVEIDSEIQRREEERRGGVQTA